MTQTSTFLNDALAAWDRWSKATGMRPSSSDHYLKIAKRFLLWFEPQSHTLRDATLHDVERFLTSLDRLSTTHESYRQALRHFFDALVAADLLSANPIATEHHRGYRRRSQAVAANTSLEAESMFEQFASLHAVEQQATVDAAAVALLLHEIHLFTSGAGGAPADVDECECVLRLGEQHGITPNMHRRLKKIPAPHTTVPVQL
jgi:hypothetical protein